MDKHPIVIDCRCWHLQETITLWIWLHPHIAKYLQPSERALSRPWKSKTVLPERISAQSLKSVCMTTAHFRPKSSFGPDVTNITKMLKKFRKLEVRRSVVVIQNTDHFIYYNFIYYSYITLYFIKCGASFTTCLSKMPFCIHWQFVLPRVNPVTISVKELLWSRNPNIHWCLLNLASLW